MALSNPILHILRLLALGAVCFSALVVLGISAHISGVFLQSNFYPYFLALAIGVAVLTLLVFPPIIIISFITIGNFFCSFIVELVILGIFWILWLVTAAASAEQISVVMPIGCNSDYTVGSATINCPESEALIAFSWFTWLIITAYWPFLLVMAVVQHNRGNPVWTKSVGQVDIFAPRVVATQVYPAQQPVIVQAVQV